jgi:mono/diheme cytochrome c family protein
MPIYAASAAASGGMQATASPASGSGPSGAQIYENNCAICHGEKMEGILPAFPPLLGVGRHLTAQQITDLVHHGKGRMPGFTKLHDDEITALLHYLDSGQSLVLASADSPHSSASSGMGGALFQQNCAFCHGREAEGGETGPDLTRSKLVAKDVAGSTIGEVVRNGRPEKNMPRFNFSDQELATLVGFIHAQTAKAQADNGHRRGVDVSDLQTGNVEAGRRYFNGAGNCASCHSPKGDLARVASRYEGLELEERMLYPKDVKSKVAVTLSSGLKVAGTLEYLDEFTLVMRDANGKYRSWTLPAVKYLVDSPVNAHVEQFPKYTDADVHDLMAYLQTLR